MTKRFVNVNPKPTPECPMPIHTNWAAGRTAQVRSRKMDDYGCLYGYFGFLPAEPQQDTYPYTTLVYTPAAVKPHEGMYCEESQATVEWLMRSADKFPVPVNLYSRPTRRHSWTKVLTGKSQLDNQAES